MPAPLQNQYWKLRKKHGRPTKFEPRFCDEVIEMGAQGFSKAQMAANFAVSRQTIDEWASSHKDFFEALAQAQALAQAWWEQQGMDNLSNKGFQGSMYTKILQARFRNDYTEQKNVALTGALQVKAIQEKENELETIIATSLAGDDAGSAQGDCEGGGEKSSGREPLAMAFDGERQSSPAE